MDPSFIGTWQLDHAKSVGTEEYARSMGADEEKIQQYKSMYCAITLEKEGDGYRFITNFGPDIPQQSYFFKPGQEVPYKTLEGDDAKFTVTFEGKKMIETHVVPCKGMKFTSERTVNGTAMTLVMQNGNVRASTVLKKI